MRLDNAMCPILGNTSCTRLFQVLCRYPPHSLEGTALKDALTQQLVMPVVANGDRVLAFRVIWRETDEAMLQAAWDAIALQHRKCDAVVRAHPNVVLFVSSITGVFTKGASKGFKPSSIYPAVSYWMVTTPGLEDGVFQSTIIS